MEVICCQSTDEAYLVLWGCNCFEGQYRKHGVDTSWNELRDSRLRPYHTFLRHYVLESLSFGGGEKEDDHWSIVDGVGSIC